MAFAVQNAIPHVDELVREYLVFRGFPKALASFDSDRRADRLKGFQVAKVVDALLVCVYSHSAEQMEELWIYLESRFFVRPSEPSLAAAIRKMRLSLRRYYLIYAVMNQRMDKVTEFFSLYGNELYTDPEWKNWFALPFVKNPELDDVFAPYFQKQWSEIFAQSLHNFLSSVFQNMALPRLLNFNLERLKRKQMESEIEYLHNELQRLTKELEEANATISNLSRGKSPDGIRDGTPTQATSTLLRHVSSDSIDRAKKKLDEEEQKLAAARKRWADETLQSSIRTTDRETIEVAHSPDTGGEAWPIFGNRRFNFQKKAPQVIHQEVFKGHTTPVSRCRFSSSGDYVASSSTDGTLRIWSLESQAPQTGSDDPKNATIFCFTEILSLAWETKSDRLVHTLTMLFCGTADGRIKLWNPNNVAIGEISTDSNFPRLVDIACSPSDSIFATAAMSSDSSEGVLYLYNFKTLQLERKVKLEAPTASLHFNHNGSLLAAAGRDGIVRVYDMSTNYAPIMQWKADESELYCVRFSRDETALFTLGSEDKINQWSIHNIGKKMNMYDWEDRYPSDIAFDWEGTHFVVGGRTSAHIYTEGEAAPLKLTGHTKAVTTVDWHPTNNLIVTGSSDASVRIVTLA